MPFLLARSSRMKNAAIQHDLDAHYAVTPAQIDSFRTNGFIKLKNVLSPATLQFYGDEITRQVLLLNTETRPMEQRSTYGKAFLQIMNIWTQSEVVREFCFARKLGRIAAELMGVAGVR